MFKRYLIAFALIAGLATLANAQAPGPWTKVGMLRCILDPSVGFIITGHELMQCSFAQSAGGPQAYEGAINMVGLERHQHRGGRHIRMGCVRANN